MLAHPAKDLASTMQALKTLSTHLLAVTMPWKTDILSYLDDASDEVKATKAANTVILREGKLIGYNTDIDGIAYALRNISVTHKNVLIMGAGGAALAAGYYLKKNHANLFWMNRTVQHALSLIETMGGSLILENEIDTLDLDIIINTTPLGMFPNTNTSPLTNYTFKPNQIIFDMVYNPMETTLLKTAKSFSATCISGLDMFIGQGLKQIELWLNQTITTPEVTDLLYAELTK